MVTATKKEIHIQPDARREPPASESDDPELKKAKPPWLLVSLAFGLPFLILVVLSFLH